MVQRSGKVSGKSFGVVLRVFHVNVTPAGGVVITIGVERTETIAFLGFNVRLVVIGHLLCLRSLLVSVCVCVCLVSLRVDAIVAPLRN